MDRYEEALAKARAGKSLDEIFPELKESEGERIRKEIISALKFANDGGIYDKHIAYLEKQKEQKPVAGENPQTSAEILRHYLVWAGNSEEDCPYTWKTLADAIRDGIKALEEQKPAEWSEFDKGALEDAICAADMLGNDESFNKGNPHLAKAFRVAKDWLKSLPERFNLQPQQEWSEKHIADIFEKVGLAKIVREQGNDDLTNALQAAMLELSKVENIGWSEEDSDMICEIIDHCIAIPYIGGTLHLSDERKKELKTFLKSLRPQPHTVSIKNATKYGNLEYERGVKDGIQSEKSRQWKPSEEQMDALSSAGMHPSWGAKNCRILQSLYSDLQKLL